MSTQAPESRTPAASRLGVSVAMATYNGERYLREQLDSIARQTVSPAELVATDDGSTDATLRILEDFASVAPFPVRIFRNEFRLGYADNFLKAASLCQGDLIAFCDQDDVWMERKLEKCLKHFSQPDVMLVAHSAWTISASGARGRRFPRFQRTRRIAHGSSDPFAFAYGFALIFRSEILTMGDAAHRPIKLSGHDQWCWFWAANSGVIVTLADPLAHYRQHEQNAFGAPIPRSATEHFRTAATIMEYDSDADKEREYARILQEAMAQSPRWAPILSKSATQFQRRSNVYRRRAEVYRPDSTLRSRLITFSALFFRADYLPKPSRTPLGARAMVKDLLFGVTGAYKMFSPGPNA